MTRHHSTVERALHTQARLLERLGRFEEAEKVLSRVPLERRGAEAAPPESVKSEDDPLGPAGQGPIKFEAIPSERVVRVMGRLGTGRAARDLDDLLGHTVRRSRANDKPGEYTANVFIAQAPDGGLVIALDGLDAPGEQAVRDLLAKGITGHSAFGIRRAVSGGKFLRDAGIDRTRRTVANERRPSKD